MPPKPRASGSRRGVSSVLLGKGRERCLAACSGRGLCAGLCETRWTGTATLGLADPIQVIPSTSGPYKQLSTIQPLLRSQPLRLAASSVSHQNCPFSREHASGWPTHPRGREGWVRPPAPDQPAPNVSSLEPGGQSSLRTGGHGQPLAGEGGRLLAAQWSRNMRK